MQKNISLALLGDSPLFPLALHVGAPQLPQIESLLPQLETVLRSGRLSNDGPQVQDFEGELADFLGVKHALAICNGTLAWMLLLKAQGLSGEVIVPSFTFPATVHVLDWLNLKPVFCDVDLISHSLDPQKIESLITPQTSAILGVHLWGNACHVEALEQIARKHRLALFFDAAHALGCRYQGQQVGGFGDAEMFSLHATKFVHSLEGGVIATHSDRLAAEIRRLRNFGYQQGQVFSIGLNAKMNELSACIGRHMLQQMPQLLIANQACLNAYQQQLSDLPGITLFQAGPGRDINAQYVVLQVEDSYALSRDQLWQVLQAEGVLARRYFYPAVHQSQPYQDLYSNLALPVTEKLARQTLVLPTGSQMSQASITKICELLNRLSQPNQALQAYFASLPLSV